ncbi:uncharacterized protein LOC142501997 isoform X2 [Ascaphus truei]|uniref:uncharacterized protein LOC142501997 isoform X2 n=1 Tax=Ascaphus truei TaxID=8439 RepID=UPI003F5AC0A2
MSKKGYFAVRRCDAGSDTKCQPCANGTYTKIWNYVRQCMLCRPCDLVLGLVQQFPCSASHETVCVCPPETECQDRQGRCMSCGTPAPTRLPESEVSIAGSIHPAAGIPLWVLIVVIIVIACSLITLVFLWDRTPICKKIGRALRTKGKSQSSSSPPVQREEQNIKTQNTVVHNMGGLNNGEYSTGMQYKGGQYMREQCMEGQYMGKQCMEGQYMGKQCMEGQYMGKQCMEGQYMGKQCMGRQYVGDQYMGGQYVGDHCMRGQYVGEQYIGGQTQPVLSPSVSQTAEASLLHSLAQPGGPHLRTERENLQCKTAPQNENRSQGLMAATLPDNEERRGAERVFTAGANSGLQINGDKVSVFGNIYIYPAQQLMPSQLPPAQQPLLRPMQEEGKDLRFPSQETHLPKWEGATQCVL